MDKDKILADDFRIIVNTTDSHTQEGLDNLYLEVATKEDYVVICLNEEQVIKLIDRLKDWID
jgi:uncharacterized protein YutD